MATEAIFQTKFVKPLLECYGQQKLPQIRILKIWEKVKIYPDHILGQCADRIILNFDNFPGVQAILNTCSEVGGEYARSEAEEIKAKVRCIRCKSQGLVQANNFAYKCTCQLGELLYPYHPLYQGQVHIQEKTTVDHEGNKTIEDGNYSTIIPAGCKSIKEIRTVIKQPISILPKKQESNFKTMDFGSFIPTEVT